MRTRIKICGITRPEDARAAADLGVDAVGFMFWPKSSRYVEPDRARALGRALPALVSKVGVVVDPEPGVLAEWVETARVDFVQFHGNETPESCEACPVPYLKAVRVRETDDVYRAAEAYPGASALLLDTYKKGQPGGTGETFDWDLIPGDVGRPYLLAGGLNAGNVGAAINRLKPYAVDVSGGVESAPGSKDHEMMAEFVSEVERATNS